MSNIITIKLKLKRNLTNEIRVFQQKYSNVVRYAFNRFMNNYSRTEVFKLIKTLNNVNEQKVIFGGKGLFYKRLKGKISHEEYVNNRKLFYISCEGSKSDYKGNRKFKFDFNTLSGSVKLNNTVVMFSCFKQSKRNMNILHQAILLAENGEIGLTYRLSGEYFYICVDLDKLTFDEYDACKDTTLAIDMNPNYIGLCIVNKSDLVIYKEVYDLSRIKNNKKRDYELTEIAKSIAKLCKHYKIEIVGYEKLKIPSGNKNKGRRFNKLVNND